ncbi:hypothetical protein ACOZ38_04025 [Sphaerisporangium viridialbum]|uniref:Orn/Lys/Arg family decarboxylase n=1 Tax=Sphaerisporangium viridialbum TaxID=46189 RepID=UPI003C7065EA
MRCRAHDGHRLLAGRTGDPPQRCRGPVPFRVNNRRHPRRRRHPTLGAIPAPRAGRQRRRGRPAGDKLRDSGVGDLLDQVFTTLPEPVLAPADCYQAMIRSRTERVPLVDLPGRIAATTVVVTPPGIPMLMPGEATGPADGPLMTYLRALEDFDRAFPDLATDIHGAHRDPTGRYWIEVMSA